MLAASELRACGHGAVLFKFLMRSAWLDEGLRPDGRTTGDGVALDSSYMYNCNMPGRQPEKVPTHS